MGTMGMAGFVDLNEYTYVYGKVMFSYVDELPSKKLPRGFYLVHNHAKPQRPLGRLGKHDFRVWVQTEKDDLIPCKCNFAGNKNAKLNKHYRVRLIGRR